jgi:hypothetical protein
VLRRRPLQSHMFTRPFLKGGAIGRSIAEADPKRQPAAAHPYAAAG